MVASSSYAIVLLVLAGIDFILDAFLIHRLFGVASDCKVADDVHSTTTDMPTLQDDDKETSNTCTLSLAITYISVEAFTWILLVGMVAHLTLEIGHNVWTVRGGASGKKTGQIIFILGIMCEDLPSAWALVDVFSVTFPDWIAVANAIFTSLKFIVFIFVILRKFCYTCGPCQGHDWKSKYQKEEEWFQFPEDQDGCVKFMVGVTFLYGLIAAGILAAVLIQELLDEEANKGIYAMLLGIGIMFMWTVGMCVTLWHWRSTDCRAMCSNREV